VAPLLSSPSRSIRVPWSRPVRRSWRPSSRWRPHPSYAGDPVEIDSSQLANACGGIIGFLTDTTAGLNSVTAIFDDDGNAVFVFLGSSCGAGPSQVVADVDAGTHPTYMTTFTIVAPTPTI
jgi:hypothetical protein